jgi:hypothetical protein
MLDESGDVQVSSVVGEKSFIGLVDAHASLKQANRLGRDLGYRDEVTGVDPAHDPLVAIGPNTQVV